MLSDAELFELAGEAAFARGRTYHTDGRVHLGVHDANGLRAEVHGSEIYALWLKRHADGWKWHCDCPAADGACSASTWSPQY